MRLNTKFFVKISDLPPRLPQGLPKDVNKCLLASFSQRQTAAVPEGLAADSSWRGYTGLQLGRGPGPTMELWYAFLSSRQRRAGASPLWRLHCQLWWWWAAHPRPGRVTGRGRWTSASAFLWALHFQLGGGDGFSEELRPWVSGSERVQLSEPFSNLRVLSKLD